MTTIPQHKAAHGCQLLLRRGPGHSQHGELITLPSQGTHGQAGSAGEVRSRLIKWRSVTHMAVAHGSGAAFVFLH